MPDTAGNAASGWFPISHCTSAKYPCRPSICELSIGICIRRPAYFMAKQELYEKPFLAWLFTALGGFPVERGSVDRSALRAAQQALEGGEPVAIFPEGTRRHGRDVVDLFDGGAYLATRLGVPIVPVGIGGSEEILPSGKTLPRPHRVGIVVGDPIQPPHHETGRVRRQEVTNTTEKVRVELQACFDEALALAGVRAGEAAPPAASEVGEHP